MIRGWFTDIRWWLGPDGIRIREFGSAARIFRLVPDLGSASSVATAGVGLVGDSTGITGTPSITTTGTTHGATRFTTATPTTGEEHSAADLVAAAQALMRVTGRAMVMSAGAAENSIDPANLPGPSTEALLRLEVMLNPAVRLAPARELSVGTSMADRQGAIRHEGASAWVVAEGREVAEDLAVAVATGDPRGNQLRKAHEILNWREYTCGEQS